MSELDLRRMYDTLINLIAEKDEQLDSLSDSETAGKRKIGNDLVESAKETWGPYAEDAIRQMSVLRDSDPDVLAGVYLGLVRELRKTFEETVNKHIESLAESTPKSQPLISEDEAKVAQEQRTAAYQQVKHVVELAASFGECDPENPWPLPNARRGARGKRGKRALSYYEWFIDGEAVPEDSNTSAGVAKLLGFDKAKDFTALLRGEPNKIDTTNPPPEFTLTANGKQVRAVRGADAPSNEELASEDTSEEEEVTDEDSE